MFATVRNLAALLALAAPLFAMADDSYLKVGVGRTTYDFGSPFPEGRESGYLLAYGAMADKHWDAEVGYVDFGTYDVSIVGQPLSVKTRALYAAGTATYPLGMQASVFGKLGFAVKRFSDGTESATRSSALFGAGARWDFSRDWGMALEYSHYGKTEGLTLSQLSLSALYKF